MTDLPMNDVIERATLAPSIHNSQPWRFAVSGETLEIYADRSRQLPAIDPEGRWINISCGGAGMHARLAIRALGHDCTRDVLPDADDHDLLVRLTVGDARPATEDELALVRAMPRRHTVRDPFDPRPVPPAATESLRVAAEGEGGWLHVVQRAEQNAVTSVLLSRAEEIERSDPAYVAELRSWIRDDDVEGIPRSALPSVGQDQRHSNVPVREFLPGQAAEAPAGPVPDERPLLVILGTDDEGPAAWVRAGEALARLLLRATVIGLAASPLAQVIDVPATRRLLRTELGLVGHPQFVLRVGYPPQTAGGGTARRPVQDVLVTPSEGAAG